MDMLGMVGYKAKVSSNNGDGTLEVVHPYSRQTMTLRCPPALATWADEGDQVIVVSMEGAGNSFVLCAADIDGFGIDKLTDSDPLMDDADADSGSSSEAARADHVHPSDTSRQETITANGILKGDGNGGISAAAAGTDYQTPLIAGTDYQTPLTAGTDYATPAMIPSEQRKVYRYNAYRAESTNTVTVQLNKDFINNGTTYSLFGALYFIDYNSTPTVDEYYMLMNPTNPNRIIRVTTNNTARNITSAAYDMSTGILTVTLSGNRAYSGVDVYVSHV